MVGVDDGDDPGPFPGSGTGCGVKRSSVQNDDHGSWRIFHGSLGNMRRDAQRLVPT